MVEALVSTSVPTVTETFSLSAQYAPKDDSFEIELSKVKLSFRALKSYTEIKRLAKEANDFVTSLLPFKTYGADDETRLLVFSMVQTSIEPKLNEADLFAFMGEQGFEFNTLKTEWERKQTKPLVEAELAEVEDQKND